MEWNGVPSKQWSTVVRGVNQMPDYCSNRSTVRTKKELYHLPYYTLNTNATIIISTFKNEIFLMLVHSI